MTQKQYCGVVFVRNQKSQKCVLCGTKTTRLISVNDLNLCCQCAVMVVSAINKALTRHSDEARAELEGKQVQDAEANGRTDA